MENSIIYKISCNVTGKVYFGSTKSNINMRINSHKSDKNTCKSKEVLENGNYKIEVLEKLENSTVKLRHERERYYIENYPCVNKYLPRNLCRDSKEYFNDYYHQTKEKELCSCGKMVNKRNKSKHLKSNIHNKKMSELEKNDNLEKNI
jgi:hypothetical protein